MGGGSWNASLYSTRTTAKMEEHDTAFVYSKTTKNTVPRSSWTAHETLDPKRTNNNGAHAGLITREALDSDEHPESTPIAVLFDVTGSMGHIPQVLQKKLPQLYGLLLRKGYVEHPQILFGGIGDAYSDRVPLQIGQFESDNRADEQLENMFLEGGGGGGNHESYQLAAYYVARHTFTDAWEKRGKKGYLFIIGDERVYDSVDRRQVEALIGDTLQENLSTAEVFAELEERWDVFFLFAAQGDYRPESVLPESVSGDGAVGWRELLGQNALILEDADAVCETIALTIGIMEGATSFEDGLDDLKAVGSDLAAVTAAGKALATVGAGAGSGSAVATVEGGDLPGEDSAAAGGTERL